MMKSMSSSFLLLMKQNNFFSVQIFQALRCAVCDLPLQMPAVHFMCKHSYHSHCYESYSDQHDRCPACASTETETFMSQTKEQRTISLDELQSEVSVSLHFFEEKNQFITFFHKK